MNRETGLSPKSENENRGYYFDVTDQEIEDHRNRSVSDIFSWLENANRFVYALQTADERNRIALSKSTVL